MSAHSFALQRSNLENLALLAGTFERVERSEARARRALVLGLERRAIRFERARPRDPRHAVLGHRLPVLPRKLRVDALAVRREPLRERDERVRHRGLVA